MATRSHLVRQNVSSQPIPRVHPRKRRTFCPFLEDQKLGTCCARVFHVFQQDLVPENWGGPSPEAFLFHVVGHGAVHKLLHSEQQTKLSIKPEILVHTLSQENKDCTESVLVEPSQPQDSPQNTQGSINQLKMLFQVRSFSAMYTKLLMSILWCFQSATLSNFFARESCRSVG